MWRQTGVRCSRSVDNGEARSSPPSSIGCRVCRLALPGDRFAAQQHLHGACRAVWLDLGRPAGAGIRWITAPSPRDRQPDQVLDPAVLRLRRISPNLGSPSSRWILSRKEQIIHGRIYRIAELRDAIKIVNFYNGPVIVRRTRPRLPESPIVRLWHAAISIRPAA